MSEDSTRSLRDVLLEGLMLVQSHSSQMEVVPEGTMGHVLYVV